jgi:hypothetical protein
VHERCPSSSCMVPDKTQTVNRAAHVFGDKDEYEDCVRGRSLRLCGKFLRGLVYRKISMRNKYPCNVYLQGSALEMIVRRSSFLFGNSTDLPMPRFRFLLGDAQDVHHNPVTSAAARLLLASIHASSLVLKTHSLFSHALNRSLCFIRAFT